MKNKRLAFTLIELLVVIAIIAILAAILFPVFARARDSARQAMCSSNFHQATLSILGYMGDHNTKYPLTNWWPPFDSTTWDGNHVWVMDLQPYVKNYKVFRCPSDPNATDSKLAFYDNNSTAAATGPGVFYAWAQRTNLGLNQEYLSTLAVAPSGHGTCVPRSEAAVAKTANTFLIMDSVWNTTSKGDPFGGGNWEVEPPCRNYSDGTDSLPPLPSGYSYYGADPSYQGWVNNPAAWNYYGGAYPWHHRDKRAIVYRNRPTSETDGHVVLAYCDGHVKVVSPHILEHGCDVQALWGGQINEQLYGEYEWDLK